VRNVKNKTVSQQQTKEFSLQTNRGISIRGHGVAMRRLCHAPQMCNEAEWFKR
jgi:hypothetical protein